jgi:hypothetical protein
LQGLLGGDYSAILQPGGLVHNYLHCPVTGSRSGRCSFQSDTFCLQVNLNLAQKMMEFFFDLNISILEVKRLLKARNGFALV